MSPLREWLIAIGTLVIIGIVIDGIRRMRRARKESSAISSGMGADNLRDSPLDEHFNPELPSGGARTISRDELGQDRTSKKRSRTSRQVQKPTRPVIAAGRNKSSEPATEATAKTHSAFVTAADSTEADSTEADRDSSEFTEAPLSGLHDQWEPEPFSADVDSTNSLESDYPDTRYADEDEDPPVIAKAEPKPKPKPAPLPRDPSQPLPGANRPPAKEVIVINVLARTGEEFQGPALQRLLEACGLLYGDMDIYHRHETTDTTSPVQFSVASAVEPGTFRPAEIAALSTPGISFFMSLPGPENALQAFNFMYETAQAVVRNLGGELKDERRSVMTSQTAEHCRQRIREFERKQHSKRD
ncbi:cell division protein ZipA [Marinobacter sp. LV10MA510-1]|uniref:cell division protein ZipA n=1 Tax=Marinobacter sp. LV10MA510-1 TaxID=1415567 RepID=UPI000BF93F3B|nr:cell division protein ZipA [Marinobacter sp. LV10MA510-1]PFG08426.1 cell division protein ZipA [Marinobacter sp. LV10MA510-1]